MNKPLTLESVIPSPRSLRHPKSLDRSSDRKPRRHHPHQSMGTGSSAVWIQVPGWRCWRSIRQISGGCSLVVWLSGLLVAPLVTGAERLVSNRVEFDSAVAQAQPGDTIQLQDGDWPNVSLSFQGTGTADHPITLRAQTPGKVRLTGSSRLQLAGSHLVVQGLQFRDGYVTRGDVIAFRQDSRTFANHCRITDCAIIDYNPPSRLSDSKWVSLYGVSNRVDHCYFAGKRNSGALLVVWIGSAPDSINDHRIDHNFFGPRSDLGSNDGETLRIGTSDVSLLPSRTLVEDNFFYRCNGEIEVISSKSGENIFRHNTFVECEGALTLRHGNGCVVAGNSFFGNGNEKAGGVRVVGEDHLIYNNYFAGLNGSEGRAALCLMQGLVNTPLNGYAQVKNVLVAFNTFVRCRQSLLLGLADTLSGTSRKTTLPPVDCRIANNLVWSAEEPLVTQRITPVNLVWEGNLCSGAALGIPPNPGILQTDPQLIPGEEGLWRPAADSPARGGAQGHYPQIAGDIDGQARAPATDIGCDQISTQPIEKALLAVDDVGPNWFSLPPFEPVEINWPAPTDMAYGTPLSEAQLNATANQPGTLIYRPPLGTILPPGSEQILTVALVLNDTPDAFPSRASVRLNVKVLPDGDPKPTYYRVSNVDEFNAAVGQLAPGNLLVLANGVWTDADLLFKGQGTAERPIILRAETPGWVILNGRSRLRIAGSHLIVQGLQFRDGQVDSGNVIEFRENSRSPAHYCRLTDCAMIDYSPPDPAAETKWVWLYGVSNRVDHCEFVGKRNAGPVLGVTVTDGPDSANGHQIDHNYFGPRPNLGVAGGEIIRIGTSEVAGLPSRTRVENNYFQRGNGGSETIANRASENVYRGNAFVECTGALSVRFGNRCVVEANLFLGRGAPNTAGLRLAGEQHQIINNYFADLTGTGTRSALTLMQGLENNPPNGWSQVKNALIAFNTFVNCRRSLVLGLPATMSESGQRTSLPPLDCRFGNNIVWNTNDDLLFEQPLPPVNPVWEGNLVYGSDPGIDLPAGMTLQDPQLVPGFNGLWRPGSNSPALGSAQGDYGFVSDDIDGQPRPVLKDVGCDQASHEPWQRGPWTASQVGPSWLNHLAAEVKWTWSADMVYGTPLSDTQLNATANVPGDFVFDPPIGTILEAGSARTLSVSFRREDQPDADLVTSQITINVLPAPLIITAENQSRGVGQLDPPWTLSYQGFVNGDTAADLDVPPTVQSTAGANSEPGVYPLVVGGAIDANYAITFVDGTLTVLPATPPIILSVVRDESGIAFLTGPSIAVGLRLTIQASSNLNDWIDVATVTNESSSFRFADPDAAKLEGRFYRAKVKD